MEGQWQRSEGGIGARHGLLDDPRYATSEDRVRRVEEVGRLVEVWVASLTATDVVRRCQDAGVPAAPAQEVGEVAEHPHTRAREAIVHRSGHRLLGSPIKFSRTPVTVENLGPAPGQHNDDVLGGLLGLGEDERSS